jgi:4-amino-4-deoxy-L-arabinose transferase-like glycosyltransferase
MPHPAPDGQTGFPAPDARWPLWLALAAVAGVFLLRFPNIVQPMGPDQGVYATIGWALQRGLDLYRDLFEQKPPGIYLTYLSGFLVFGHHTSAIFWIDYLAGLLLVLAIFGIGRALVGVRFGALAAAITAIGTFPAARHAYGGFLERAVTESFIIPLAALAAWCAVMAFTRTGDRWAVTAGLLIGMAAVYKQTALIYWPAFTLWLWAMTDMRRAIRFGLLAAAGVIVAPALALAWLWSRGVLGEMWVAVVEFNLAYLALGDHGFGFTLERYAHEVFRRMKSDEVWAIGTLASVVAVLSWRGRHTPPGRLALLGLVWLGAAMIATIANGPRLFTTYFMPSLVPLTLLTAWLFQQTLGATDRRRIAAGALVLVLAGGMMVRAGSARRAADATLWDARHLVGQTDRQEYLGRFRSRATQAFNAATNDRLADYVGAHTEPHERVFVFGMTAGTYFSSERLPASRFLWAYAPVSEMLPGPDFTVGTLAAELARTAPRYIILQRSNADSFSGWRASEAFQAAALQDLIRSRYVEETEIGDFVLYRRVAD